MTIDWQLAKLKEGVQTWNSWRNQNTDVRIDLSEWYDTLNLTKMDLHNANFSEARMTRCDLSGSNVSGADFSNAHLRASNLRGADLRSANLRNADLRSEGLDESDTQIESNLSGADLRRADLSKAHLDNALLRDADLSGTRLYGASLFDTDLTDAKLTGTDLRQVKGLTCKQLTKAKEWEKSFRDAQLACGQQIPPTQEEVLEKFRDLKSALERYPTGDRPLDDTEERHGIGGNYPPESVDDPSAAVIGNDVASFGVFVDETIEELEKPTPEKPRLEALNGSLKRYGNVLLEHITKGAGGTIGIAVGTAIVVALTSLVPEALRLFKEFLAVLPF